MNIKAIKTKAKQSLKKHYLIFVLICLVAGILGIAHSSSLAILNDERQPAVEQNSEVSNNQNFNDIINSTVDGIFEEANKQYQNN